MAWTCAPRLASCLCRELKLLSWFCMAGKLLLAGGKFLSFARFLVSLGRVRGSVDP